MSAVRTERDGDVLLVTLDRPERRNAFDAGLIAELAEAFAGVGDARAVVLAGEGQSFCAGADVEWQRSSIELSYEENVEDYRRLWQMLNAVWRCPAPVVGRDPRLRTRRRLGPDVLHRHRDRRTGCGLRVLRGAARDHPGRDLADACWPGSARPRRGGTSSPGERFDAATALRIGLVHEVAERPRRGGRARASRSSSPAGPVATRQAKKLVLEPADEARPAARAAQRRTSDEGQEGLRAFLEKRRPAGPSSPAALQFRG